MNRGYIKLWRKTVDSRIFQNEGLLKVWIWCLLKANHESAWVSIKTGKGQIEIFIKPGQFVFGRESAAKELRMKPSTVWLRIRKLKDLGNCDIQSNTQYSIITIINWEFYQSQNKKDNSQHDRQMTGKEQPNDTNKNDKNIFKSDSEEIRLSELLFSLMLKNNPKAKKPNLQTWAKHIDRLHRIDGHDYDDIERVVQWSQKDTFWLNNILSTEKLRKQFDSLWLQMGNKPEPVKEYVE